MIDLETTSESGSKDDNTDPYKNIIICMAIRDEVGNKIALSKEEMDAESDTIEKIVTSETIKKAAQNGKFDFKTLAIKGFGQVKNFYFDPQTAGLVLDSRGASELVNFSLVALYERYIGVADWKIDYSKEHTIEEWKSLCLDDVEKTWELMEVLHNLLQVEELLEIFKLNMVVLEKTIDIELIGVPVDREMAEALIVKYERNKVRVDKVVKNFLRKQGITELVIGKTNKKGEYKEKIVEFDKINTNSSDQLKAILYNELKYPEKTKYDSKTKKRKRTTDKNALAELNYEGCEFARYLLYQRYWTKLVEYANKIVDSIGEDGRIHGEFNPYGTETARFSSRKPNMQQIPAKTTASKALRKAIRGNLAIADYSNMELRILAAMSEDTNLLNVYFNGDGDVHQDLIDSLKKNLGLVVKRNQAKNINFGVSYGAQGKGLAIQLNVNKEEPWKVVKDRASKEYAQELIDAWYEARPEVKVWQSKVVKSTEISGYSESQYGHRRYIDYGELVRGNRKDEFKIAELDRKAINHAIQATGSDVIKLAIYALRDENIILQVHDELVIENPKRSIAEIKEIMENVVDIGLKLVVDIGEAECWADK